jgi:hypothetical protein
LQLTQPKVLERIKMRGVVMAFSSWSQNAHAGKEAKALLKRISFRMMNQTLIAVRAVLPASPLHAQLIFCDFSAGTSGPPP